VAMEWIDDQSLICAGCGQSKLESMDPAMAHSYEAVPVTCYGCAACDAEKRNVQNAMSGGSYSDSAFDGMHIGVKKKE
jgi:hypothetical protein